MQRQYHYFEYQKALLHYSSYGRGNKILLCFHGFGQSSAHFQKLEEALNEEYIIYSFDLFYHGKSFWHEKEKPLSKFFWNELMSQFLKETNIDRFALLGFSMGGKFALATLENFFLQVDKFILIAPDGVKTNFWYSLATYPFWMRKLFRSVILKPKIYVAAVNVLGSLKLIDKGVLRFANTQMMTREQRRRVYYSWIVFRELKFDMKDIAFLLNKNHIQMEMFLGEYDKIITQKNMKSLLEQLDSYSLNILKSGHTHLLDAVANFYHNKPVNGK